MMTTRMTHPYVLRRLFYGVVALIGAVLFGLGVGDAAQIDQWTEVAERLVAPVLMILSSSVAGVKANAGSDTKPATSVDTDPPTPAPSTPAPGADLLATLRDRIEAAQREG